MRHTIVKNLCVILIGALLFGQVGVGYLHDPHTAHETPAAVNDIHKTFQKHGEHCKVCSVDLFVNMLAADNTLSVSHAFQNGQGAYRPESPQHNNTSRVRDRAPPVLS